MSDYIKIGDKNLEVRNPYNPGGIKETLRRWYEDKDSDNQSRWVTFDGVTVSLHSSLSRLPDNIRSICLVKELGCVIGDGAHLTLEEFLHNDY